MDTNQAQLRRTMTSHSGEQNNMAAVSWPCPLCKGKLVSSRKVRNSHMKICCNLPEERGEEGVEGEKPSEEADEVQGEPVVWDTESEELEQESVEDDLQQLLVREALPLLDRSYCGAK